MKTYILMDAIHTMIALYVPVSIRDTGYTNWLLTPNTILWQESQAIFRLCRSILSRFI